MLFSLITLIKIVYSRTIFFFIFEKTLKILDFFEQRLHKNLTNFQKFSGERVYLWIDLIIKLLSEIPCPSKCKLLATHTHFSFEIYIFFLNFHLCPFQFDIDDLPWNSKLLFIFVVVVFWCCYCRFLYNNIVYLNSTLFYVLFASFFYGHNKNVLIFCGRFVFLGGTCRSICILYSAWKPSLSSSLHVSFGKLLIFKIYALKSLWWWFIFFKIVQMKCCLKQKFLCYFG